MINIYNKMIKFTFGSGQDIMNKILRSLIVIFSLSIMTSCTSKPINEGKNNEPISIEQIEKENEKENEELKLRTKLLDLRSGYMERMDEIWQEYNEWGRGDLSNAEQRSAIIDAYNEYDKILNEIYQDLKKYLKEDEMQKITDEQLEWIKYKEEAKKEIQEIGSYMEADRNELGMTKTRCEELVNYFIITKKDKVQNEKSIDIIINDIHNLLGKSRDEEKYVHRPDDNYVSDDNLRKDNYIFTVSRNMGGEDYVALSYNILVNKNNYEVYYYYPDGSMKNMGNLNN